MFRTCLRKKPSQSEYKKAVVHIDGITPNLPIMHRAYIALIGQCWSLHFLWNDIK